MVIIYSKNASFLYLAVQLFWVVKNMLANWIGTQFCFDTITILVNDYISDEIMGRIF